MCKKLFSLPVLCKAIKQRLKDGHVKAERKRKREKKKRELQHRHRTHWQTHWWGMEEWSAKQKKMENPWESGRMTETEMQRKSNWGRGVGGVGYEVKFSLRHTLTSPDERRVTTSPDQTQISRTRCITAQRQTAAHQCRPARQSSFRRALCSRMLLWNKNCLTKKNPQTFLVELVFLNGKAETFAWFSTLSHHNFIKNIAAGGNLRVQTPFASNCSQSSATHPPSPDVN